MKLFAAHMRLADVIQRNHLLLPGISRFGIPPGFGEHSIHTVCELHRIDVAFFLAVLNAFGHAAYAPARRLRRNAILPLVSYLEQAHAYYRTTVVPRIEELLNALLHQGSPSAEQSAVLRRFFRDYKEELLAHLNREETITFPYIRALCDEIHGRGTSQGRRTPLRTYSMQVYEAEHNDVDGKLDDLKNIILCHMHTTAPPSVVNELVDTLFRFERDLDDHTRIEDHILRPLVKQLERELRLPARHAGMKAVRQAGSTVSAPVPAAPPAVRNVQPSSGRSDRAAPIRSIDASSLTVRERDVLHLVARGFLNKQIADALGISMHTVISHRKHITEKLRIRTVAGLTMYALLSGIITTEHMQ